MKDFLISIIDKTSSAMGKRMLRRWLNQPLRDTEILDQRRDVGSQLSAMHFQKPEPVDKLSHPVCCPTSQKT